jgi:hypothetical protein
VRRGGLALKLYENSLLIAFGVLFVGSVIGHALGGAREYSAEQQAHGGAAVGVGQFVTTSSFWFQSFQNWQSEFLAVGAIVVLSIFLRQRGSPNRNRCTPPTPRPARAERDRSPTLLRVRSDDRWVKSGHRGHQPTHAPDDHSPSPPRRRARLRGDGSLFCSDHPGADCGCWPVAKRTELPAG